MDHIFGELFNEIIQEWIDWMWKDSFIIANFIALMHCKENLAFL